MGSCSSSLAWPSAREQCLLRVEPDTLWNGLRLVGDMTGRRDCPGSEPAFMEHILCAGCCSGLWGFSKGSCSVGLYLVEEDREKIREVIKK